MDSTLGRWLAVAVLATAAFGLTILLTMSAVSRWVREFAKPQPTAVGALAQYSHAGGSRRGAGHPAYLAATSSPAISAIYVLSERGPGARLAT